MRFQYAISLFFLVLLTVASVVQFQKSKGQRMIASVGMETDENADIEYAPTPVSDSPVYVIAPAGQNDSTGVQLRHAMLTLNSRQSFMSAVREVFGLSGSPRLFETGQMLTPDFRRAISPETQQNLCSDFIGEDGEYGDLGRMIVYGFTLYKDDLAPLIADSAADKAGMKMVCPQFSVMTPDQRKDFWVWTMATVALFESTCGYDTTNEQNRHAVGMFQLNESIADREPRSLIGNHICGRLTRAQIAPATNNTACALDFMRDSFSGRMDHAPPGLITDAQQFERLRNGDSTIIRVLKKFRLCQTPGSI